MPAEPHDNVSRKKAASPIGRVTFIGLRAAVVVLHHSIIHHGWVSHLIQSLGGVPVSAPWVVDPASGTLQPYYRLIVLMAFGSSVKQILTMLIISEQKTPVSDAIVISLFNTIVNSLNTLLSLWSLASCAAMPQATVLNQLLSSPLLAAGAAAYFLGLVTELVSELQRTAFKRKVANKGKAYAGGLFSLARHINYGCYAVWRASYALTTGGPIWSAVVFYFFFCDFAVRRARIRAAARGG